MNTGPQRNPNFYPSDEKRWSNMAPTVSYFETKFQQVYKPNFSILKCKSKKKV